MIEDYKHYSQSKQDRPSCYLEPTELAAIKFSDYAEQIKEYGPTACCNVAAAQGIHLESSYNPPDYNRVRDRFTWVSPQVRA